ncbi:MAG: Flp pilus assembly protein CpaB [Candidatus Melainabacteria bacterium]|nr:Flp pilus assembly protein CpaB [Candidatus Melainabacteria bacterium]
MAINPSPLSPKTKNKINSLVVMASLAMFLGLIAATGVWQYLSKTQEKVKALSVTKPVVVAGKQILAGTKLQESDLAIKQFPVQAVPKDYPSSISSVKDRIVKATLQADEVVTETRLVGQGASGGLPVVIPKDLRAITIRVNEVVGVGGFINPGDRVDIVSILKSNEQQTFSKTILQNILVLAVGDKILDINSIAEPQAKIVAQVTLALGSNDAEKIALASEVGQLHLVLRPFGEDKLAATSGVNLEDIYGDLIQKPEGAQDISQTQAIISANENENAIEIILGDERSYYYY